jgi:hypothetical protein
VPTLSGDIRRDLETLVRACGHWDSRAGGSRLNANSLPDDAHPAEALPLITRLGLVNPAFPLDSNYQWAIVPGGLLGACRNRIRHLRRLIEDEVIKVSGICLLGSFREIFEYEFADLQALTIPVTAEVDALRELANLEFPSPESWSTEVSGDPLGAPRAAEAHCWRSGTHAVHVFAAKSSDPGVRPASTVDTYHQVVSSLSFPPGTRLIVVTTQPYALYQHFDAVRILGLPGQLAIETVGTLPALRSNRVFQISWYLQEIYSTLLSALALVEAAGR